ncbi:MBL fold metallo-hydrolase [Maritalea sp.]|uniref:MBL fold metallo-hydrolase n=1 Tax=Maritalea sp. TaxID=2003361 RepID=UPI003EF609D4
MMGEKQSIEVTILGCGSSGGVPRVGGNWGDCDPKNPKNRRRRCSLLIRANRSTTEQTTVLIDTGCDIREQLLEAGVTGVDAVFYTHDHADHTHGIDDLRVLALNEQKRVEVYANKPTLDRLKTAFSYCFQAPQGSSYPPILNANEISDGQVITIDGDGGPLDFHVFNQQHGNIVSLGFRVANLAYSCDVSDFPKSSHKHLKDLDVWIVDALRRTPHPSHLSFGETLSWIEKMQPKEAYLTNMHIDLDYETVQAETPDHIMPAFDGLTIKLS